MYIFPIGDRVGERARYTSLTGTLTAKFSILSPLVHITLVDEESRECYNIGYITAPWDYEGEIPTYTIDERTGIKTYKVYGDPYPPLTIEANSHSDNKFLGWYDEDGVLFFL